jgi:DNA-binding XRE family transcriptional regulator
MTLNTALSIKSLRCKKLKSQQEIANKIGVARQTYNGYENNILKCDLETVLKILEALECNKTEIKDFFFALEQDILSYLGLG